MPNIPPIDINDFKTYFARDFNYGTNLDQILDSDIIKAINQANIFIHRGIIPDNYLVTAFQYLTAHFLVINYRMSFNGVQSVGQQIVQSNSQGVTESYAIAKDFTKSTVLNSYAKTDFGLFYLSIIKPLLIGNVGII